MPRLMSDMEIGQVAGRQNFQFSGVRTERLSATEYTLVTIAVDVTGSVCDFENELRQCLIAAIQACQNSPRSEYLLARVIFFSDRFPQGVKEVHGFLPLEEIDLNVYSALRANGMTTLYDACYSSIGAMNEYARKLRADDFGVNAIAFILTDGDDNASMATPAMVKEEIQKGVKGEFLESMVAILVGVNAENYAQELQKFQREVGITQYVDVGQATERELAKLADFVSRSISLQSQALADGDPVQMPAII